MITGLPPFDLGLDPGPQPWSPPGIWGQLLPTALASLGTDRYGRPFLTMPTLEADSRTIHQRVFAQNTLMASQHIKAMEEMAYGRSIANLVNTGQIKSDSLLAQAAFAVGSPMMSMFMGLQDSTYGAMKQGLLANSAQIMASVTGGETFRNPAANAVAMGALYSSMYKNTWGNDFTKRLGFTYGLTEQEMAPLAARVATNGAFNNELLRIGASSEGLKTLRESLNARDENGNYKVRGEERINLIKEIHNQEESIRQASDALDRVVNQTMRDVNRTVSSMKGLFGTTENAAAVLGAMFGEKAFDKGTYDENGRPTNAAAEARQKATTLSNQLISMAGRYGVSPEALGGVMTSTMSGVATGLGYTEEEQRVGFGGGFAAWAATNAAFSAGAAAGGDRDKFLKLSLGFSQRMSSAAQSQNMKAHTMLQYALNEGSISDGDAARLRSALSSGDQNTRKAAIRELFESYGGYQQGLDVMNSANTQAIMQESFTDEQKRDVWNAVSRTITNQGKMSVENMRNKRTTDAARKNLRAQGYTGKQIREMVGEASADAMMSALGELGPNGDAIRSGADEVEQNALRDGKSAAEAKRMKADYLREAASSFLSGEDADKVISAGNTAAAEKLSSAGDKESSELSRKIAFAKRQKKSWSKEERELLRSAEKALKKGDKAQAKSLFDQFISKTGSRGKLIASKDFSSSGSAGSMDAVNKGLAADAAGMRPPEAMTLGEEVKMEAEEVDKAAAKDLGAQVEETAKNGEKSVASGIKKISENGIAGFFINDMANAEDFNKSKIGEFLNKLNDLLKQLWGEIRNETERAKDGA